MNDARTPVIAAGPAAPPSPTGVDTAFVIAAGAAASAGITIERLAARPGGHRASCRCCTPRAALAEALHRLFLRRARGEAPFFRRVVVAMAADEVAEALADPLVASRFRADPAADARHAAAAAFRCD